ncbi:MAG: nucleoside kinase [Bacteroidaceae bacterium]|nr:nucleoside kinase [Bacteroidaceae bacterium]
MREEIIVRCINNGQRQTFPAGTTIEEVYEAFRPDGLGQVTAARVNNVVEGLSFRLYNNKDVEFLDLRSDAGLRTYVRSLFFVMGLALREAFPDGDFRVEAPVSGGYFCRLLIGRSVTDDDIQTLRTHMDGIINRNAPFHRVVCPTDEAVGLFEKKGMQSKVTLLSTVGSIYAYYYTLEDHPDYYYGALLPRAGQLGLYDIMRLGDGVLVRVPDQNRPSQLGPLIKQEKMLEVIREHKDWQDIVRLRTIGDLNKANDSGYTSLLINVAEALQEKKICHIAEEIQRRPQVRLILIAGPSSSGKTTFSKRLSVQLMACGLRPFPISMDDYFVDRTLTPRDEKGDYDFESVDALNIPLLSEHLQRLFAGEEIELPRYNFQTGKSESSGKRIKLSPRDIVVMEGIHALNPKLTESISDLLKFKVFVSALTTILLDDHNNIPTTDNRLLRRIVRDYKYRGYSATETIGRWPSVMKGEEKWIVPFQENADVMFNSALLFELALLCTQALPLLEMVPENVTEYAEAYRLRKFLGYIKPIPLGDVPPTSLLREFLGGSSFHY